MTSPSPEGGSQAGRTLRLERARRGIVELRRAALAAEEEFVAELEAVDPAMRESARNLVHYLAVRRLDVRELQDDLARLGLSSLGRMESHVMASLDTVLEVLESLLGKRAAPGAIAPAAIAFDAGPALLGAHAERILGPASGSRTRIMVTMPGEAADDPALIRGLVEGGMQIMRVNCAHDGPDTWERMVKHLRQAARDSGRRCLVSFDLAGPKLRTGPIEPGPAVRKWRPTRDAIGRVTRPARVCLVHDDATSADEADAIPVGRAFLAKVRKDDRVELSDARGRRRILEVVEADTVRCVCHTRSTGYVVPGTRMVLTRKGRPVARATVGELPAIARWILLRPGDVLEILRGSAPGRDAVRDEDGHAVEPAFVSCELPEVFTGVRVGEPILFDDGKVRGTIRGVAEDRLRVEITAVAGGVAKLRSGKGINLPESELDLPALTAKDIADIAAVARNADMVALSFVQRAEDIESLIAALPRQGKRPLGIVLKIETLAAFNRLPSLLLAAMRHPPLAVMVARGDLGVEVGFERLSEVQEEVLWLCEAAHVPVIWATQVLESLAKGGLPSRAEVTDAAMGGRAECVMLNKGPFILETLRFLKDVLGRMEEHQHKKTARLRKLRVSDASRLPKRKARPTAAA